MNSGILWHNPRCSKSRQTVELLNEKRVALKIVKYLEDTPSAQQIAEVLDMLDLEPRELMRKRETVYQELDLDDPEKSRETLIKAMVDNPILIERPVFIYAGRAQIGRPPESVLRLLET